MPYFNGLQLLEKLELRSEIQNAVLNVYRRKSCSSNSYKCIPEVSHIQTTSSHQPVQRQIYRPYNVEENFSLQTSEQIQWNIPRNLVSTTVQCNVPNTTRTVGVDIPSRNISLDTNQHLYSLNKIPD